MQSCDWGKKKKKNALAQSLALVHTHGRATAHSLNGPEGENGIMQYVRLASREVSRADVFASGKIALAVSGALCEYCGGRGGGAHRTPLRPPPAGRRARSRPVAFANTSAPPHAAAMTPGARVGRAGGRARRGCDFFLHNIPRFRSALPGPGASRIDHGRPPPRAQSDRPISAVVDAPTRVRSSVRAAAPVSSCVCACAVSSRRRRRQIGRAEGGWPRRCGAA